MFGIRPFRPLILPPPSRAASGVFFFCVVLSFVVVSLHRGCTPSCQHSVPTVGVFPRRQLSFHAVTCYTCLVISDEADVFDCFGTLIIIQSLSAVPVGVAPSPRETCHLFGSHRLSDLLSHSQLDAFSATSLISFTAFVLSFPVNPICLRARIVDVPTNPRHPTSTG